MKEKRWDCWKEKTATCQLKLRRCHDRRHRRNFFLGSDTINIRADFIVVRTCLRRRDNHNNPFTRTDPYAAVFTSSNRRSFNGINISLSKYKTAARDVMALHFENLLTDNMKKVKIYCCMLMESVRLGGMSNRLCWIVNNWHHKGLLYFVSSTVQRCG